MSSPETPAEKKKLPIVKLAVAAGAAILVAAVVLQLVGWRVAWDEAQRLWGTGMAAVTGAGPAVFFAAMAVLPAFGVPTSPLALAAAPLFASRLGLVTVTLCGLGALTLNLIFTYWLARRWLRPWLTRLLARLGYQLPQVGRDDMTDLIVLLRVTPGVPFFVQNYLLGLADVPFGRYLAISCVVQWSYNTAFIAFGDALSHGNGKRGLFALMLFAALIVGTHLVRKHYGKKKPAAAAAP